MPNSYWVELVMADGYGLIEKVERADRLDVVFADILSTGKIPGKTQGYVVWPAEWEYSGSIEQVRDLAEALITPAHPPIPGGCNRRLGRCRRTSSMRPASFEWR